jgi:hypothetical protein
MPRVERWRCRLDRGREQHAESCGFGRPQRCVGKRSSERIGRAVSCCISTDGVTASARVRLALYAWLDALPPAVAEGCGEVQLTIGGRAQPPLEGGATLIDHIEELLDIERL